MKSRLLFSLSILILASLLIAACGTAPPAEPTATPINEPDDSSSEPVLEPEPTAPALPTAESLPADYPPPQPTTPSEYPGPTTPTSDPYPGGMVWILRPVGIQCEDGTDPGYGDLGEAVATLTAAGLRVVASEMTELLVTASCGSPTSAHNRIQIEADDLETALSMGWFREGP